MIKSIVMTDYQSNCYLLESSGRALLVDPGEPGEALRTFVNSLHLEWIINTHAHPDHIGGDFFMAQVTGAPILLHQADLELFKHLAGEPPEPCRLEYITEGQTITLGDIRLDVLHTPGHSPGSVTLRWEAQKALFTGDLLFAGSIGRTDFPGGSDMEMRQSLRRVAMLPGDWRLYPGHGPETSLERERRENPFLVGLL